MYINSKWKMHLHPERPGGPSGWRAFSLVVEQGPTVPYAYTLVILFEIVVHQFFGFLVLTLVGFGDKAVCKCFPPRLCRDSANSARARARI